MRKKICFGLLVLIWLLTISLAQASGIKVKVTSVGQRGENVVAFYDLTSDPGAISPAAPAYVFLTYGTDSTNPLLPWNRVLQVSGDVGIVTSVGSKTITWNWYSEPGVPFNLTLPNAMVKVQAIEMVKIPEDASLIMGNDGAANEVNGVIRVAPFYMMKYPVTVMQYVDFLNTQANNHDLLTDNHHDYWAEEMADNTYGHIQIKGIIGAGAIWQVTPGYDDYAMAYVSWFNAYDYASWAGLELCMEEEFEKAARGTDSRRYNWGTTPPNKTLGNYENNVGYPSDVNAYEYDINKQGGSSYGAYDLAGNVWEWQNTYAYSPGSYDSSMSKTKYASSPDSRRVLRGGCWKDSSQWMRAAARRFEYVPTRSNFIGFRCVKRQKN